MKLERRYYVAATSIKPGCDYLTTLDEAITKATDFVAGEGAVAQRCIVEVVAVVSRVPPPVTVEHITTE